MPEQCGPRQSVLAGGPAAALLAVLEPQEGETDDWQDDVASENDAGIAGREIMRGDHLIDMTAGSTP